MYSQISLPSQVTVQIWFLQRSINYLSEFITAECIKKITMLTC